MKSRSTAKVLFAVAVLSLVAASCGDSSTDTSGSTTTQAVTTTAAEATTTAPSGDVATTTEAPPTAEAPTTTAAPTTRYDGELVGLFSVDPAVCDGDEITGSYFRMLQPGGTMADGPYVPNTDSVCTDPSYSPLLPGTDGGFTTGAYQPAPDPAFDDGGNGLAGAVTAPTPFFGVAFAVATNDSGAVPSIEAADGVLTGDLSGWSANYANMEFNQGAPKPDDSMPGLTTAVTGNIDSETGAYSIDWASQIVGGSFNEFTGIWHLEGVFTS